MMDNEKHKQTFDRLFNSFEQNFDVNSTDKEHFMPVFECLADALCVLEIKDIFVDVSRKQDLIDFNLTLENGLFLSVAKNVFQKSDDVMFAIARNSKTLVIDEMPLAELMKKLNEIIIEYGEIGSHDKKND